MYFDLIRVQCGYWFIFMWYIRANVAQIYCFSEFPFNIGLLLVTNVGGMFNFLRTRVIQQNAKLLINDS